MCVCTVWIDVKLRLYIILYYIIFLAGGTRISSCGLCQRSSTLDDQVNVPAFVPPLGAFKTQLGGTYNTLYIYIYIAVVLYCHCLLWSYVCIYIYIFNFHRKLIRFPSNLHVTGFSSCRITSMIHSYLVCVCVSVRWNHSMTREEHDPRM